MTAMTALCAELVQFSHPTEISLCVTRILRPLCFCSPGRCAGACLFPCEHRLHLLLRLRDQSVFYSSLRNAAFRGKSPPWCAVRGKISRPTRNDLHELHGFARESLLVYFSQGIDPLCRRFRERSVGYWLRIGYQFQRRQQHTRSVLQTVSSLVHARVMGYRDCSGSVVGDLAMRVLG
jgi:hypothetical protein